MTDTRRLLSELERVSALLAAAVDVRLRPNPGDRRSSLLELTPAGTALLATAERRVDSGLNDLLGSHLSKAEVTALTALLHELRTTVHRD
jgi:MarR family transcriptional regulator, organic hydroperoxide resistance regulator